MGKTGLYCLFPTFIKIWSQAPFTVGEKSNIIIKAPSLDSLDFPQNKAKQKYPSQQRASSGKTGPDSGELQLLTAASWLPVGCWFSLSAGRRCLSSCPLTTASPSSWPRSGLSSSFSQPFESQVLPVPGKGRGFSWILTSAFVDTWALLTFFPDLEATVHR
jgi:hypothetical protein